MDDFDFEAMKRWQWWIAVVFIVFPWAFILISVGIAMCIFESINKWSKWASVKTQRFINWLASKQYKFEDKLVDFAKGE